MLQVGEVARQLDLNPQTLYFYERIGLIPPLQRTESGYRLFSQQDVDRLVFITRTKALGLTLDEIKDILMLRDGRSLTCGAVYERLASKLAQIEQQIQQLQTLQQELQPLLEQCQIANPQNPCIALETPLEH
ncbi:MAG: MerR family DNA-binding protein [Synechococcales cyanobacterium T60_A2020_003]|nr:MerR family DNA-binding protein [Synechococcales cyanobacterium T60_A2020_003]